MTDVKLNVDAGLPRGMNKGLRWKRLYGGCASTRLGKSWSSELGINVKRELCDRRAS